MASALDAARHRWTNNYLLSNSHTPSLRSYALNGKGKVDECVEKEIDELQCKLTAKTREIEALVAEELNLGDINAIEGTTYARLRTYVEERIEKWQQANVDRSGSNPDTVVN